MPARIFVVEDDEIITHIIREILTRKGYTIAGTATSGEEAVSIIERTPCDVILMDIGLKGDTDGITVARILSARIRTPIIFVTGQYDDQILERAKTPNTFGYIIKPFSANDLTSNIEIALFNHRLRNGIIPGGAPVAAQIPAQEKPGMPTPRVQIPAALYTHTRIPDLKHLYDHGFHYQKKGRYDRALQYFIEILAQDPQDAPIWVEKGDVLMNMGRSADALAAIEEGLRLDPGNGYALCKKCRVLCSTGRLAEALDTVEAALETTCDKRTLLVEKGMILHEMGRNEDAFTAIDSAIEMNRKCGYALGAKGRILGKLGMNREALSTFGRALNIEPKNISLWMDLVRLFEQKKNYHTALNVLQMAIEKNPENEILTIKRDTLLHLAIPVS